MANLTAWNGGLLTGQGIGFQAAFGAEINGLASQACVMSTIAFDNTVALDQFMDISFKGSYASPATITSGLALGFFMACLQNDGVTYGDGRLTAGTQVAGTTFQPVMDPLGGIALANGTSITPLIGDVGGIIIRPRAFRLILQNNSFGLAATGQTCSISTYKQNMNA